ncbi:MAG TPA: nucleotide sugar dehydrogenase, partial [Sphingomicrobium sp.]|nr:nucleotide sugar dehydrogenase [Sphingomicrobium sp.]
MKADHKIAVVGLGYVGLPLAVALAAKYPVIGFDISGERVAALKQGVDSTREISAEQLRGVDLELT